MYRIAGGFRGHLFSRISRISASRKNIFREILGATPSSRSAPMRRLWVWSGFGLIAKIFFAKFAPVSNSRKYRSAKKPGYTVYADNYFPPLQRAYIYMPTMKCINEEICSLAIATPLCSQHSKQQFYLR